MQNLVVDWEHEAPRSVAALRAEAGRYLGGPDHRELITESIEGSAEFAALWTRQDLRGRQEGLKRFQHSELGRLGALADRGESRWADTRQWPLALVEKGHDLLCEPHR